MLISGQNHAPTGNRVEQLLADARRYLTTRANTDEPEIEALQRFFRDRAPDHVSDLLDAFYLPQVPTPFVRPLNGYLIIEVCDDPSDFVPVGVKVGGANPMTYGIVVATNGAVADAADAPGGKHVLEVGELIYTPGCSMPTMERQGQYIFALNYGKRYGVIHQSYLMGYLSKADVRALGVKVKSGNGMVSAPPRLVQAPAGLEV